MPPKKVCASNKKKVKIMEANKFWEKVYSKNASMMLGVCRMYIANNEIAEDIMQDSFIRAIEKFDTYKNKGCFEGWLRKIAVNCSLMYLRQKKYESKQFGKMEKEIESDTQSNVSENIIAMADFSTADLTDAIDMLPEHHKLVFNLYVIDNYSHSQIAQELNISVGTSKSHLARARKKIKKILHKEALKRYEEKKKERVFLGFLLLVFPKKENFVDNLFKKEFKNPKIEVKSSFTDISERVDWDNVTIPKAVSVKHSAKFVIPSIIIVALIGGVLMISENYFGNDISSQKTAYLQKTNDNSIIFRKQIEEESQIIENNSNFNQKISVENQITKIDTVSDKLNENKFVSSNINRNHYTYNTFYNNEISEIEETYILIFKNFDDYKIGIPTDSLNYEIVFYPEIENKTDTIYYYDINCDKFRRKNILSLIYGFEYENNFYINPNYPKKLSKNKHFVKTEDLGKYLYYRKTETQVIYTGTVTTVIPTTEQIIVDKETGEKTTLSNKSLKKIIADDKELLNEFKNEKKKSKKLKEYLIRYLNC